MDVSNVLSFEFFFFFFTEIIEILNIRDVSIDKWLSKYFDNI